MTLPSPETTWESAHRMAQYSHYIQFMQKKTRTKIFRIVNYLITRTCPWSRQLKNRTSIAVGMQARDALPQCSGAPHCGLQRTQPLWFCSLFIMQRAACSVQSIPALHNPSNSNSQRSSGHSRPEVYSVQYVKKEASSSVSDADRYSVITK
jgi:hypothetical protein